MQNMNSLLPNILVDEVYMCTVKALVLSPVHGKQEV